LTVISWRHEAMRSVQASTMNSVAAELAGSMTAW